MNTTNQLSAIEKKVREILVEFREKYVEDGNWRETGFASKYVKQPAEELEQFIENSIISLITTTQKEAYKKVNRVEVIDHTLSVPKGGRIYVKWEDKLNVEADLQDNDRTLKIFISTPKEGEETK